MRREEILVIEDCNKLLQNEPLCEVQMDTSSFLAASEMAALYQYWKDLTVTVTVIPQTGTDARNGYIAAFFTDPADKITRSQQGRAMMLNAETSKESSFSRPLTITKTFRGKRFTVAPGKESDETEIRFISFGKFCLMATGPSGISPGGSLSVRVQWKATFMDPIQQRGQDEEETPTETRSDTGVRVPGYGTVGSDNYIYASGFATLLPKHQQPTWDYSIWRVDAIPEDGDIVAYDGDAGSQTYSGFCIAIRDNKGVLQLTPMMSPGFDGKAYHGGNKYMPSSAWNFTSETAPLITCTFHSQGNESSGIPQNFRSGAPPPYPSTSSSGSRSQTHSLVSLMRAVRVQSSTSSGRFSSTLLRLPQASWVSPTQWCLEMRKRLAP